MGDSSAGPGTQIAEQRVEFSLTWPGPNPDHTWRIALVCFEGCCRGMHCWSSKGQEIASCSPEPVLRTQDRHRNRHTVETAPNRIELGSRSGDHSATMTGRQVAAQTAMLGSDNEVSSSPNARLCELSCIRMIPLGLALLPLCHLALPILAAGTRPACISGAARTPSIVEHQETRPRAPMDAFLPPFIARLNPMRIARCLGDIFLKVARKNSNL